MVKGFDRRYAFVGTLFLWKKIIERRMDMKEKKAVKEDVIAYRKGCEARGTGLSHYILMDRKAKK